MATACWLYQQTKTISGYLEDGTGRFRGLGARYNGDRVTPCLFHHVSSSAGQCQASSVSCGGYRTHGASTFDLKLLRGPLVAIGLRYCHLTTQKRPVSGATDKCARWISKEADLDYQKSTNSMNKTPFGAGQLKMRHQSPLVPAWPSLGKQGAASLVGRACAIQTCHLPACKIS